MEERIKSLEAEVQTLKGQPPAPAPAPAQPVEPPPPTVPVPAQPAGAEPAPPGQQAPGPLPNYGGAAGAAAKVFNPDISLIGDFVGAAGNPANRFTPSLEMHESELGLQAIIDPYARGDVFLTFGEQRRQSRRGLLHLHQPSRRLPIQGRQDALGLRPGEPDAQPRPAVDRPAAGDPRTWSVARKASATPGSLSAGSFPRPRASSWKALPNFIAATVPSRFRGYAAQRCFHGRTPARLQRHHRIHQYRSWRLLTRAATARSATARTNYMALTRP